MSKTVLIPILNNEYKVVVCLGDMKYLRKTLVRYNYNPETVTESFLAEQTENRLGVTFRENRCYSVIWVNSDLSANDSIGTLAHEAVHAVDFIFEAIDENMYHSEIFAHSVGAIVRTTLESIGLFKTEVD